MSPTAILITTILSLIVGFLVGLAVGSNNAAKSKKALEDSLTFANDELRRLRNLGGK